MLKTTGQKYVTSIKYGLINHLRDNKIKLIFTLIVLLLGILTGIFCAVKFNNSYVGNANDILLGNYIRGEIGSISVFFSRFFSILVMLLLLSLCGLTPFLYPVGALILAYRAYLIGFNLCLMIVLYGFSGILTSFLVILPCQLAILLILGIYFNLFTVMTLERRKYGPCGNNRLWLFLICLIIMLIINIIETVLLCLFNSQVIIVI